MSKMPRLPPPGSVAQPIRANPSGITSIPRTENSYLLWQYKRRVRSVEGPPFQQPLLSHGTSRLPVPGPATRTTTVTGSRKIMTPCARPSAPSAAPPPKDAMPGPGGLILTRFLFPGSPPFSARFIMRQCGRLYSYKIYGINI
jgi:hypothetical protein